MADNARGIHVSPGVYSREVNLNYAVKSLGITTLGLVGETQRGPAFQPMPIENWREFQDTFGGTSTEKFEASQYPKYELPYIAKSYLTESNQLEVCRVLGLSGYNAGPAWLLTAPITKGENKDKDMVVAVLRSRGDYQSYVAYALGSGSCDCSSYEYDKLTYDVGSIDFSSAKQKVKVLNIYQNDEKKNVKSINKSLFGTEDCEFHFPKCEFHFPKATGITIIEKETQKNLTNYYYAQESGGTTTHNFADNLVITCDYVGHIFSGNQEDYQIIINVDSTPITASNYSEDDKDKYVIVDALGHYLNKNDYDSITYKVEEEEISGNYCTFPRHTWGDALQLHPYVPFESSNPCEGLSITSGTENSSYKVQSSDYGHFKLRGIVTEIKYEDLSGDTDSSYGKTLATNISGITPSLTSTIVKGQSGKEYPFFEYSLSLNPSDKDYILKVLGTNPHDGSAPIYVESLYDVAFQQMVDNGYISNLNTNLSFYDNYSIKDFCQLKPVDSLLTKKEDELTRKDVGKRVLCSESSGITCHMYDYNNGTFEFNGDVVSSDASVGDIYTVRQYTDHNSKRHYYYAKIDSATTSGGTSASEMMLRYVHNDVLLSQEDGDDINSSVLYKRVAFLVKNLSDGYYYKLDNGSIGRVFCDLNNYKSQYRFASTPWIVSNLKGDYNTAEVNKMFRFHTISDGTSSNNEIKISIANIKPDDGTFDVIIRDINDTDASMTPLESFSKCNMNPGSNSYIGYLIGTYNGDYETKSKYVTVEINESLTARNSSPAGFLGYPLPRYDGTQIFEVSSGSPNNLYVNKNATSGVSGTVTPRIAYNCIFDDDTKHKRQYFGLSDRSGVDIDLFTFKGNGAYPVNEELDYVYLTPGFHLDSRIGTMQNKNQNISVEGQIGYTFDTVSTDSITDIYDGIPLIGTEKEMKGSIFEYVDLRKFTVYFYGGFDGWDEYRDSRSNGDDFKMTQYKGQYSKTSGEGYSFDKLRNPNLYKIDESDAITSDYYAYLSAIRQFANPEEVDINVFATPGIDMFNNKLLVEETIDMIEEERADSIYIVTTPDKPYGAEDYTDEMYTPDDIIENLEDTEIDSNYTCTYYPWIKYYDEDNYQYINLPVTKDVVRNMALTDNTTHPWFAPAGISRGDVSCEHAHYITTLSDEDVLYEGRVNPVKTFANDGVKLWGQKNLQIAESQLNRIAVRRLLLRMRKLVAIACRNLIFEPNDNTTKASFISTVTPILDNIKSNRGISDYKLEVNDSQESRDRRELPAKIYFKPYNALEYITLDFIVTPEGVSFDNI